MNYTEIVLNGYCNSNSRDVLESYFFRKFKEAEQDFYTPDEFFNGCFNIVAFLENEMVKSRIKRINELNQIINWNKRGMQGDADTPKEPTTDNLEVVKQLEKEIEFLSCENFPINLFHYNNKYSGQIFFTQLNFIKLNLQKAKNKALGIEDIIKKQPQQDEAELILQRIWLATAKISVKQFLEKGIDLGIWDSDLNLTQQRGAKLYGSGKTLLASLAGALKNYAIMESLDYKIIGRAFCKAFNIKKKKGTKDPYKAFSMYNEKYKKAFVRSFNIRI